MKKGNQNRHNFRHNRLFWGYPYGVNLLILFNFWLVEAGGVEPPSGNIPFRRLHT